MKCSVKKQGDMKGDLIGDPCG